MKQNFNLHTHTYRCGHAAGTDEQYIQSAIEAGIEILGFSDHMPYPQLHLPGCRMEYAQAEEYRTTMQRLKKKYEKDITILCGYEAEYLPDTKDLVKELYDQVDYLILGQHFKYIKGTEFYDYDCYNNDEDVVEYVNLLEEAAATNMFTYIAHPDYFMLGRRVFSKTCQESATRIAQISLQYDLPLELNLNGPHYGTHEYLIKESQGDRVTTSVAYPFYDFWKIISRYQCKVCFGYDAHTPLMFQEQKHERQATKIVEDLHLNFIEEIQIK